MLRSVRLDALLEIALERLAQGTGGLLVQGGQAIHCLFCTVGDDEVFGTRVHGWSSWLNGQTLSCLYPERLA
ncbi:hypothetical protein D9M68_946440 [compost metagenome]